MILEVIACKNISGIDYLLGNTRFQCYNNDYNNYTLPYMLPLLLLWVFLIPLLIFLSLRKLNNTKAQKQIRKLKKSKNTQKNIQNYIKNRQNFKESSSKQLNSAKKIQSFFSEYEIQKSQNF